MLLGKRITSTINILEGPKLWLRDVRISGVMSVYARRDSLLEMMQESRFLEENPKRLCSLHLPLGNPSHFTAGKAEKPNI